MKDWHRDPTWLIAVVLLMLLARHVWVASFIHPYADDLSYAVSGARSGVWEAACNEYRSWNGRYFANILVLRSPLQLGLERGLPLYRLMPVLLMFLTVASVFTALRSVFGAALSKEKALLAGLAFVVLYIHLMPHAGEGLYWYTGAVTYLVPDLFILLCVALLAQWEPGLKSARKILLLGSCIVLLAAIVGSNEVVMVQVILLITTALFLCWKHSLRPVLIGLLTLSLLFASVVYFAPGNDVRGSYFPNSHDLLVTLSYGAAQTVRFTGLWSLSPVFLITTLLLLQWGRTLPVTNAQRKLFLQLSRWIVLALPIALVFVAMALPYWSTGILGQHRTANAALFVFLPSAWLCLLVWDAQVFQARAPRLFPESELLRYAGIMAVALSFLFLRQDGAVTMDWNSAALRAYDEQHWERYILVNEAIASGLDTLDLKALRSAPLSLKPLDLSTVPSNYMNSALVLYLGGDTLAIRVRD